MKEVLAEQFDIDSDKITRETDLMNDLGADSLDLVELIMTLEEEYGVSATDESVYEHKAVGELMKKYGLNVPHILAAVESVIKRITHNAG
jgi:acyl carrier protein